MLPHVTEWIQNPPQVWQAVPPSLFFFTGCVTSYFADGFFFLGGGKKIGVRDGRRWLQPSSSGLHLSSLGSLWRHHLFSLYSNLKLQGRTVIGRLGSHARFWSPKHLGQEAADHVPSRHSLWCVERELFLKGGVCRLHWERGGRSYWANWTHRHTQKTSHSMKLLNIYNVTCLLLIF